MSHLTLYAYEEDRELVVYRCPVCGSSGEEKSRCEAHEPPLADREWVGPTRVSVRVPRVGEEARYTLEQVGEGLLSDGAKLAAEKAHQGVYDRPGNDGVAETCELVPASLEAALDHFTQQPAGVGADADGDQHGEVVAGCIVLYQQDGDCWRVARIRSSATTSATPKCSRLESAATDSPASRGPRGSSVPSASRKSESNVRESPDAP